jgi:hypothetical protein
MRMFAIFNLAVLASAGQTKQCYNCFMDGDWVTTDLLDRWGREWYWRVDIRDPSKIEECKGFVCPDKNGRPEKYAEDRDEYGRIWSLYLNALDWAQDYGDYGTQTVYIYKVEVTGICIPDWIPQKPKKKCGGKAAVYQAPFSRIKHAITINNERGGEPTWQKLKSFDRAVPKEMSWHAKFLLEEQSAALRQSTGMVDNHRAEAKMGK